MTTNSITTVRFIKLMLLFMDVYTPMHKMIVPDHFREWYSDTDLLNVGLEI